VKEILKQLNLWSRLFQFNFEQYSVLKIRSLVPVKDGAPGGVITSTQSLRSQSNFISNSVNMKD
jgi:hypothetical protein